MKKQIALSDLCLEGMHIETLNYHASLTVRGGESQDHNTLFIALGVFSLITIGLVIGANTKWFGLASHSSAINEHLPSSQFSDKKSFDGNQSQEEQLDTDYPGGLGGGNWYMTKLRLQHNCREAIKETHKSTQDLITLKPFDENLSVAELKEIYEANNDIIDQHFRNCKPCDRGLRSPELLMSFAAPYFV